MDAYQKWTTFYDSKSKNDANMKNTAEIDDMYHYYSKNANTASMSMSPRISTRQSIQKHRLNPFIESNVRINAL